MNIKIIVELGQASLITYGTPGISAELSIRPIAKSMK